MGGPGVFTITGEDEDSGVGKTTTAGAAAAVTGAEDTGPFLSADNADRLEEANYNFEDGVLPRIISTSDPPAPYTDKAWSIAFVVNVCVTVIAAVCFRHSIVGAVGTGRRLSGEGVGVEWIQFLLVLTICALLAWGLAWGALSSLVRCPNAILQALAALNEYHAAISEASVTIRNKPAYLMGILRKYKQGQRAPLGNGSAGGMATSPNAMGRMGPALSAN
eukprot:g15370.t1